ncbi:uncharacterized protein SCHCODRAFT_02463045, partial [Schizophyllum commune H4-8]|uniref:uncharacterized protein n=1 Tax=Schizophyllum commune (strain H4-8 / FGSC 9210) TaxID=578458 RepID=UPI00215F1B0B
DTLLHQYSEFLDTLEAPHFESVQKKRRFLSKAMEFFKQGSIMYRKRKTDPPQRVVLDLPERGTTICRAHD